MTASLAAASSECVVPRDCQSVLDTQRSSMMPDLLPSKRRGLGEDLRNNFAGNIREAISGGELRKRDLYFTHALTQHNHRINVRNRLLSPNAQVPTGTECCIEMVPRCPSTGPSGGWLRFRSKSSLELADQLTLDKVKQIP